MTTTVAADPQLVEEGAPRPKTARWIAIGLAMVLFAFLVVLATREPAARMEADSPLLGQLAPAIEGPTLDGRDAQLADHLGRYVVVNFFATWCIPCREEHDDLVRFHDRHAAAKDAVVVSVIYDDQAGDVQEFFADEGGDWDVIDDSGAKVDFGVRGVPESFLVDPEGYVVARIVGGVDSGELERLLQRAKAGS